MWWASFKQLSLSYFFSFSLFSFQVLVRLQSSMSFLLVSLLILSSYLFLNIVMTQAHRKIFKLYLWKSVIHDLRATKNRQTRIFQFNGILFKVVYVVQNKIDAYPSWDKSITDSTNASTSYLWGASFCAPFV